MAWTGAVNVDLATVWGKPGRKDFIRILGWGDLVEVEEMDSDGVRIKTTRFVDRKDGSKPQRITAYLTPKPGMSAKDLVIPAEDSRVLKVNFIDVQQGDGAVIETPKRDKERGKVILVDGGDNQLFARYLAGRFATNAPAAPQVLSADARQRLLAETLAEHLERSQRLFTELTNAAPEDGASPDRAFHLLLNTRCPGAWARPSVGFHVEQESLAQGCAEWLTDAFGHAHPRWIVWTRGYRRPPR